MARGALMLNRPQMLRALPKHVFFAALSGAIAGFILYFLNQIELEGQWNLLMALPIGAIYVNAAMMPLAIPGRHWSFGFIGAMLMFLLMIVGAILSRKFAFPHSREFEWINPNVNTATFEFILSGGCLGLFYGMLCGRSSAMIVGTAVGSAMGFVLGIYSRELVNSGFFNEHGLILTFDHLAGNWRYNSPLHFAWQLAAAMALLHLGACLGAAMGAGPAPANPQSEIRNPK